MSMTASVVLAGQASYSTPSVRTARVAVRTNLSGRVWAPVLGSLPVSPSSRPIAKPRSAPAKTHRKTQLWSGWSTGASPAPWTDARSLAQRAIR